MVEDEVVGIRVIGEIFGPQIRLWWKLTEGGQKECTPCGLISTSQ